MAQQNRGPRPIERLIAAVVLTVAATLAIGWLALLIARAGISPVVLFPIAVGAAVGSSQALIFRRLALSPPLPVAAALGLVLGLAAVAAEDYWGYRQYVREYEETQRGNHLASIVGASSDQWKPISLDRYVASIIQRDPLWWSLDVALTAVAAAATVFVIGRADQSGAGGKSGQNNDPPPRS